MWRAPVRALGLALFDRGSGDPTYGERIDWAVEDLASFLAYAGPRTSFLFNVTVAVIELAPLFITGSFSRMSKLSAADRAHYLEAVDKTRLSIVLVLPKALLSLVYYEHPDALRETGFDGSCLMGELPEGVGLVQIARKRAERETGVSS